MNFLRQLFFAIVFCISLIVQANGQKMELIDAVDRPDCEDLLARLDFYSHQVAYNSMTSIGQIILFPGLEPIENAKYEKYVRAYVVRRKVQDKLFVYTAEAKERLGVEFWSGPVGTKRTVGERTLTRKLSAVAGPILFDSDLFEMFIDKRKRKFVGVSCSACCISNLDWNLLSEFLDANPNLIAYVVIRGRPSRHRALKAELNRDMRDAGYNERRTKYLFAGKNLVNTSHFSEVAVFLSPKNIRSANALRSDFGRQE
jgi:hypothetical protein